MRHVGQSHSQSQKKKPDVHRSPRLCQRLMVRHHLSLLQLDDTCCKKGSLRIHLSDRLEIRGMMPISDCDVRDPRMKRTRQLLQAALQRLLQEKTFDEILVQDIAEAATVNRATFYDHYTDKFALFDAMIASDFHRFLEERNIRFVGPCSSALAAIILAVCDYLKQSHANRNCAGQGSFTPLMDAAI